MAAGQLVLVPIFLRAWGEARYGEWLTLSAMAAQIALVDFGVQTYVVNRLNQNYARGEIDQYNRVLHSALYWSLALAAVAFVIAASAIAVLPIESWFQLKLTNHNAVTAIGCILALQVVATVPFGLITGIYRTVGEFPTGAMINNLQRVVFFALTGSVLLAGGGMIHVAAAQFVPIIASLAYVLRDIKRRHPDITVGISKREAGLAKSFLAPSSLFFLIRGSQAATIQGATLIVGAFFGSAVVAAFVTLRTLCNLVRQVSNALVTALWPELTSIEARGDFETLRRVFTLASKVITATCLAAAAFLFAFGEDLVDLWTQGRVTYHEGLMNSLLLLLVLQTPWLVSSVFLMATNRHRLVSKCYVISSISGLALGLLLAQTHGIVGLVIGLAVAEILVCGWAVPNAVCQLVHESTQRFFLRSIAPLIPVALIVGGLAAYTAEATAEFSLSTKGLSVGLSVAFSSILATYFVWLNAEERTKVRSLIAGAFSRAF